MEQRAKEFAKIEEFDQAMRKIISVPKANVKEPKKKRQGKTTPRRK
ncbi:MAG TPA: hypothetical protein VMR25_01805 [Planctomycetaceae bacterium]|jgi:hypothetical protein|nr:hypothetical protein [Planctomycetaceae bacterium]